MSPDSASTPKPDAGKILQSKFEGFLHTLSNTLTDFTALEVNTMIVSGISGAKFNALDAYQTIYERGEQMQQLLAEHLQAIDRDLKKTQPDTNPPVTDQIKKLEQTRSEYNKLSGDLNFMYGEEVKEEIPENSSPIPDSMKIPQNLWPRYVRIIDQLFSAYKQCAKENVTQLPSPDSDSLNDALQDVVFVRTLRKLSELRAALDGEKVSSTTVDLIYAQTIMQLDGDVINRYHEKLFDPSNMARRDIILSIHHQGVQEGERQWRGLMEFMVNLLKNFLPK